MAATAEAPAKPVAKDDEFALVDVGPLKVRVAKIRLLDGAAQPAPTVERIVQEAARLMYRGARPFGSGSQEKQLLDAKAQRGAAQSAVTYAYLHKPDGNRFTKAELAPLVTAVRKQLNSDLRASIKANEKRRVEEQRAEDRVRAADAKLRAKAQAAADKAACAVILPEGAKPSKVASKDETQRSIQCGHVVKRGRGDTATWWLCVTDSYRAAAFPLEVTHPSAIAQTTVPLEALKAIEKVGAFRVTKKGAIQPLAIDVSHGAAVQRPGGGQVFYARRSAREVGSGYMPVEAGVALRPDLFFGGKYKSFGSRGPAVKHDGVLPSKPIPVARRLEVTFDATLLAELQAALGKGARVTLELDSAMFERGPDKVRRHRCHAKGCALRVHDYHGIPGNEVVAIQMPVDPTKGR